uniref:Reverse transcriptase domain-containing protein n=1 Tax=Macrostomum lignano TaxID=282301 RepID=A0A1I8FE99_9PLAT
MNQQPGRRFVRPRRRSQEARAIRKRETLPSESAFDSNCITASARIHLARLQDALIEFAQARWPRPDLWRGIRTPASGEHKIMEFHSLLAQLPAMTRHPACLYGRTLTSFMLCLPAISRTSRCSEREVWFPAGKKDRSFSLHSASARETITLFLLHLSCYATYIDIEFRQPEPTIKFRLRSRTESSTTGPTSPPCAHSTNDTLLPRSAATDMRWMKAAKVSGWRCELERLGQAAGPCWTTSWPTGQRQTAPGPMDSDPPVSDDFLADEMHDDEAGSTIRARWVACNFDETERRRQTQRSYVRGCMVAYISDVRDFADLDLQFDLGHPFLPFQSSWPSCRAPAAPCLPDCSAAHGLGRLARCSSSTRPRRAAGGHAPPAQLTEEERARNCFRPHLLFQWDRPAATAGAPRSSRLVSGLAPTNWRRPCAAPPNLPGFPVLRGLPFTAELRKAGVEVFQFASRARTPTGCSGPAAALLGKTVLAGWPHLSEVHAVAVSSTTRRYTLGPDGAIQCEQLSDRDAALMKSQWDCSAAGVLEPVRHLRARDALSADRQRRCWPCAGLRPDGTARSGPVVAGALPFVLQRCLPEPVPQSPGPPCAWRTCCRLASWRSLPKGNWYGMSGPVLGFKQGPRCACSSGLLRPPGVPHHRHGAGLSAAAAEKPLSPSDLDANVSSSATDTRSRRLNIGLELKFNRAEQEVAGWTAKTPPLAGSTRRRWPRCCCDYAAEFPELFRCSGRQARLGHWRPVSAEQIWGGAEPPVERLTEFLRSLPCYGAERVAVGSSILSGAPCPNCQAGRVRTEIPAGHLYRCQSTPSTASPTGAVHRLKDRVVLCRRDGPPLDSLGTIIGIRPTIFSAPFSARPSAAKANPELELLLDEPFEGGIKIRGSSARRRLLPCHGERTTHNIRLTVACKDRPDQHVQLWADLQQHKQQAGQSKPAAKQQQQPASSISSSSRCVVQTSQPWCPPCSSSSLCSRPLHRPETSLRLSTESAPADSLLAEWDCASRP